MIDAVLIVCVVFVVSLFLALTFAAICRAGSEQPTPEPRSHVITFRDGSRVTADDIAVAERLAGRPQFTDAPARIYDWADDGGDAA